MITSSEEKKEESDEHTDELSLTNYGASKKEEDDDNDDGEDIPHKNKKQGVRFMIDQLNKQSSTNKQSKGKSTLKSISSGGSGFFNGLKRVLNILTIESVLLL